MFEVQEEPGSHYFREYLVFAISDLMVVHPVLSRVKQLCQVLSSVWAMNLQQPLGPLQRMR